MEYIRSFNLIHKKFNYYEDHQDFTFDFPLSQAGLNPFRYTQLPAKFLPRKVEGNRWAGQALNLRR